LIALLLVCSLINSLNAQITASQAVGNWIDDGNNSGLDTTKCCAPVATAANPLVFSAGSTSSQINVAGKFGTTGTGCTATGLTGQTISATNQAVSSSVFSVPITYAYSSAATATSASTTVINFAYPISSTVSCTSTLTTTGSTTITEATFSTWVSGAPYTVATSGTANAACCYPTTVTFASTNQIVVTWPTSTVCQALGLPASTATTYTGTAPTQVGSTAHYVLPFTLSLTPPAPTSAITLGSATTATWAYNNGNSCSYTLKKSTSGANTLAVSVVALLSAMFYIAF